MTETTRTITATPCGLDRFGEPLKKRTYVIDRDPEDWGDGRSRIWTTHPKDKHSTPVVVHTDSIATTENRETVWCDEHPGEHPLSDDCKYPHYTAAGQVAAQTRFERDAERIAQGVAEAEAARVVTHKLIRKGKRAELWGECTCGQWAWLGTYEAPTGRAAKLHAAHAEHVAQVTE